MELGSSARVELRRSEQFVYIQWTFSDAPNGKTFTLVESLMLLLLTFTFHFKSYFTHKLPMLYGCNTRKFSVQEHCSSSHTSSKLLHHLDHSFGPTQMR
jgi:hypothetical protein